MREGQHCSIETKRRISDANRIRAIERHGGAWYAAKQAGAIKYISYKPCEQGHVERYVKSRACVQCTFDKHRNPVNRARYLCTQARWRAKKDHLPFNLTSEYVRSLWPENDFCPILRKPFYYKIDNGRNHGANPLSPTLDRIIPILGYVKGNVKVISHFANTLKNDCTDPAIFRSLADYLEANISEAEPISDDVAAFYGYDLVPENQRWNS